ncbi:LOW QUALITY PROTEIN: RPA-interacting protein A-like [Palaemon carinicauda]|uniref:LOW QUALITY PROTEIN: RPA-interacting protein A-like n=1 Tax=Palaemon carinicauda TaxID=392227 RepID=UPI0035B647E8
MESSPKNLLERRMMHKKLYKNARGRAPPWKEAYRQRCMERLRASRSQLVDRFRSAGELNVDSIVKTKMVQDIMEVEWTAMNNSNGFLNSKMWSTSNDVCMTEEEDPSAILALLMEEIQQELISEEERLLNEILNFDAAAIANQVSSHQSEDVICPVCQVAKFGGVFFVQVLKESAAGGSNTSLNPTLKSTSAAGSSVLTCSCGLALQGANVTLSTVKSSLENTVSQHSQTCMGKMSFTPTTDTQGTNVLSTCNLCDWMAFLL